MKIKILCLIPVGIFLLWNSAAFASTQIILRGGDLGDYDQFRTIAVGEGLNTNQYNHYGNTTGTAAKLCALTEKYYTQLGLDKPYTVFVGKTANAYSSCWNDQNHVWRSSNWVTEGACNINSYLNTVTCESAAVILCSQNSDCGTNGYVNSPFCQYGNVYQDFKTYSCANPGTTNSSCSNNTAPQLKTTCGQNQTCSAGACVNQNIICSQNSDCGTNAYEGNPFCRGNSIYKNFRTYLCSNPGTANSFCSSSVNSQLLNNCGANQICQNGNCVAQNIICHFNSDCGTNGYVNSPFCQYGNVYQDFKTYSCANPGTTNSSCSNNTAPQLKTTCGQNQTCSAGACVNQNIICSVNSDCNDNNPNTQDICLNPGTAQSSCQHNQIVCNSNSDCAGSGYIGSPFCQSGNNVSIFQTFRTFVCNNPGTANSSCAPSDATQKKSDCAGGQICSAGVCANQTVTCSSNSDCLGSGYIGSPYCQNSATVYQTFRTFVCNNPGTANSSCAPSDAGQLKTNCNSNQTCSAGTCQDLNNLTVSSYATPSSATTGQQVSFIATASGGNGNYTYFWSGACSGSGQVCNNSFYQSGVHTATVIVSSGSQTNSSLATVTINQNCSPQSTQRCLGNSVYWYDSCGNQGGLIQTCGYNQTCQNGTCQNNNYQNNCFYHSYQRCNNNYLYWYDSCGNQQDFQYCQYGCQNNSCLIQNNNYSTLTANVTAKNLSNGLGWYSNVAANPSDVIMFMITLVAQGNQNTNNVFVRDIIPYGLTYRDNLVVSGANNYNYSSNDIASGINIGTISAGQTVTITYQAQVGQASNFSYGTSALTDNVSVTSSLATPGVSNATVTVNKTAVFGATTISTGLTNNFLVDSFFLPLMVALLGIWLFKSGVFGLDKWTAAKKMALISHKAKRQLKLRISKIKEKEKF